jgi:hypothetical protein
MQEQLQKLKVLPQQQKQQQLLKVVVVVLVLVVPMAVQLHQ